jgi:nucleotide-binding universal stress UspA family protein
MASTVAIRRILFPTDFSAYSAVAGRAAADLARQFGARLHVLHVVPPVTDPTPAPAALRSVVGELGAGLTIDTHVSSGVPARQIVTYARRAGIDLIVMGRHGRTGVSGLLLGSVAEAVARRAPCWVLIVPVGLPERKRKRWPPAVWSAVRAQLTSCARTAGPASAARRWSGSAATSAADVRSRVR